MPQTKKQEIGKIGEDVACQFLVKRGYKILDRNYWKKWGEIDIVAQKDSILHFIEVKTVSRETLNNVSDETFNNSDNYQPEDNVHPWKLKRLSRTIQTYLLNKNVSGETDWQIDVMAVFLDLKTRQAKVRVTENIIL